MTPRGSGDRHRSVSTTSQAELNAEADGGPPDGFRAARKSLKAGRPNLPSSFAGERLSVARRLSLAEVAAAVGFADQSHPTDLSSGSPA
jgi:hypothetical protein